MAVGKEYAANYCQNFKVRPVGFIKSWMPSKSSAPHQGAVCPLTRATVCIDSVTTGYTNPHHTLHGLEQYSHVWLIFLFHLNPSYPKAKVSPPHLDGDHRVGVFSCRTPHRLNPIGLTLTRLERITGNTLYLSGVDLVDGTPVIDIKPYIPQYDHPTSRMHQTSPIPAMTLANYDEQTGDTSNARTHSCMFVKMGTNTQKSNENTEVKISTDVEKNEESTVNSVKSLKVGADTTNRDSNALKRELGETAVNVSCNKADLNNICTPEWVTSSSRPKLIVSITSRAEQDLGQFSPHSTDPRYRLQYLTDMDEMRATILTLLSQDPRSVYRRNKCTDRLFYHTIDCMHLTCWCDNDEGVIEVVKVKPTT